MHANKFNVDSCKNRLLTTWVGTDLAYIEKTESTNSFVKSISSDELVHGSVVITDIQTNGRGQYERKWESAPFLNLTFTITFRPPKGDRLSLLNLSTAMALTDVLQVYLPDPVKIKWPNDLICQNKKIGGLLTECIFYGSKPDRVIIGIGLNVNQKMFSKEIDNKATSLYSLTGVKISREELLANILHAIEIAYQRWHKFDNNLIREINNKIIGYGEWIKLKVYDEIKTDFYKFIGVNEKGELLMLNEQMDVNKFSYEQVRIITGSKKVSETGTEISA